MSEFNQKIMDVAIAYSKLSFDPSTKVGAVIVDENNEIVSLGYNRIPEKIPHTIVDMQDKDWKYARIVHAEQDALLKLPDHYKNSGRYLKMFVTHHPCEVCAKMMIHHGICAVHTYKVHPDLLLRWPGMKTASVMFKDSEIPVTFLD